jgi:hypothetical protein
MKGSISFRAQRITNPGVNPVAQTEAKHTNTFLLRNTGPKAALWPAYRNEKSPPEKVKPEDKTELKTYRSQVKQKII